MSREQAHSTVSCLHLYPAFATRMVVVAKTWSSATALADMIQFSPKSVTQIIRAKRSRRVRLVLSHKDDTVDLEFVSMADFWALLEKFQQLSDVAIELVERYVVSGI